MIKKTTRVVLAILVLAWAGYGQSQKPQRKQPGITIQPGESIVWTSTGTLTMVNSAQYSYLPKPDITPYEIALLLPLFSGPSYGMGQYSTGGAIVPSMEPRPGCIAGSDNPAFSLTKDRLEKLGTAARHLMKCQF